MGVQPRFSVVWVALAQDVCPLFGPILSSRKCQLFQRASPSDLANKIMSDEVAGVSLTLSSIISAPKVKRRKRECNIIDITFQSNMRGTKMTLRMKGPTFATIQKSSAVYSVLAGRYIRRPKQCEYGALR